jgi:hypothetical protein
VSDQQAALESCTCGCVKPSSDILKAVPAHVLGRSTFLGTLSLLLQGEFSRRVIGASI